METANIMLALAGDTGNTVPKFGVTAAEVAVLQAIHGSDAVTDIDIQDKPVERKSREERARLLATYGKMMDGRDVSPVSDLFPGAASRVFESFSELDIPDEFYKATGRAAPDAEETDEDADRPEDDATGAKDKKPAKASKSKVKEEDAQDMPDAAAFR